MIAKFFSHCLLLSFLSNLGMCSFAKADDVQTSVRLKGVPQGIEIFLNTKKINMVEHSIETEDQKYTVLDTGKIVLTHLADGMTETQICVFVEKIGDVIVDVEYTNIDVTGGKDYEFSFWDLKREAFSRLTKEDRQRFLPMLAWPLPDENPVVFISFTASWCGPCQHLKKRSEWRRFEREQRRRFKIVDHNDAHYHFWVRKYGIDTLPSMVRVDRTPVVELALRNPEVWTGPEQITENIAMVEAVEQE